MITKNSIRMDRRAREFIDALLSDKKKPSEEHKNLIGNIGAIANQYIHGWAVNTDNTDLALDISIFAGNQLVGFGRADHYREDLKNAGYGNGCHGFKIHLDRRCFTAKKLELTLRDSNTGCRLTSNKFTTGGAADYVAEFVGVTDRRIVAEITSNADEFGEPGVEILTDGKHHLPCTVTNVCGNKALVEAVLEDSVFDGTPHSYEVMVNSATCVGAIHVEVLHPIVTPESIIKDSLGGAGYPFASKTAIQRYQSLVRQMEQSLEGSESSIANLLLAHRKMESGPQKNASYPVLKLPKVLDPDVSVIISAQDDFAVTYHCIASLILSHNQTSYEVILVDDASSDDTASVEKLVENIRVIRNAEVQGPLLSNNVGAEAARGRYICLLNHNTEVTAGWIDNAISCFTLYKNIGSVGSKLIAPDGKLQAAGGIVCVDGSTREYGKDSNAGHPSYNYTRQVDYLSVCALFVKKEVWTDVGGLSPDFHLSCLEDADLAFKVRQAGYKTLYCPASTVIHFKETIDDVEVVDGQQAELESTDQKFQEKWVDTFKNTASEGERPAFEVDSDNSFRVLVIDSNTPKLNNDAGSYAAIQEMKLLIELGAKLVFLPLNFAHMGKHTERLQSHGIECLHYPFYTSVEQVMALRGAEFDLVYITRYETVHAVIDSVKSHSNAKIAFNNADLHFMRELREELQSTGCELSGPLATREKELEAINAVDVTLCYTETERAIVASHLFTEDNIKRCPWVVNPVSHVPSVETRRGMAFLGGFNHRPNVEAVKYFCEEIMPLLVERDPEIVLKVYGSGMPDELKQLSSKNVVLVGFVEDLNDLFSTARVFVSPLLTGAGLNGKMIDCMAYGLPSVISPLTADGTGLVHRQSAIVAESVEDWVDGICELNNNDDLWNTFSTRSLETARTLFSREAGIKRMSEILASVGVSSDASGRQVFNADSQ